MEGIEMLELIFDIAVIILCGWLFIKGIGLAFKITWGISKIIATILLVLAVPALIICLIFAGGVALLVPVAMVSIAFGLLKNSI